VAVDYRQLESRSLLQPVMDDSAGDTASRLARSFKEFSDVGFNIANKVATKRGAEAGAKAGMENDPGIKQGWRAYTASGAAYNDAALRSYALKSEAELEDEAARLEVEAGNDPARFQAGIEARRKEVMKNAPAGTEQLLTELYTRRTAQGMTRLSVARAEEIRKQQRVDLQEGVSRHVDRIGRLLASKDPRDQEEAAEEQAKLNLLLDGSAATGTVSATELGALRQNADRQVMSLSVRAKFDEVLKNPYENPLEFISKLKETNKASEVLPPDEEEKLIDSLLSDLREHNALNSATAQASVDQQKAIWAQGEKDATVMLLSGRLNNRVLKEMVESDKLDPGVARTLRSSLESSANTSGKSDERALFEAKVGLLEFTEEDIRDNPNLTWSDKASLIEDHRRRSSGWEGTPEAREGKERIDRALGIVPGTIMATMDPEQLRVRERALTRYYNEMAAIPAAERQMRALEISDKVVNVQIRNSKSEELKNARAYVAEMERRPTEGVDEEELKARTKLLDFRRNRIKQLEAELARGSD
jgi:hypothetical protein